MSSATALVLEGPRRLVRRDFPVPSASDNDAVLRVEACGLCGTDHEQFTGALPGGLPFVPGHETVGTIEEIGGLASERFGVSVGDRVAVEVFQSCRDCAACDAGEYRRCERHGIKDMYGFIPTYRPPSLWGGYAQLQYLSFDTLIHKVPEVMDPIVATLFNPVGAGIRWGVTLPGTSSGDVVAVLGPGIRGLSVAAAAKWAGAGYVLVTGKGTRDSTRLSIAGHFGADLTVDVPRDDPVRALHGATGRLADIVVDVTAKAPEALAQAISLARPGGTVVVAGTRGVSDLGEFHPDDLVYKELRLLGALGVDTPAYLAALDLLASGRYPFDDLPRRVSGFDDTSELLASMASGAGDAPIHAVMIPS